MVLQKTMSKEEQQKYWQEKKRKKLRAKKQRQREINSAKKFRTKYHLEHGYNEPRYVLTLTGLAPYNTKGKQTIYLLPANTECVMEKASDGWFYLYLTNGHTFDSIEDIRTCKCVKAKRHEFKYLNKKVKFSSPQNIAHFDMLKTKYIEDGRQQLHKLKLGEVYTNGNIVNQHGERLFGKALAAVVNEDLKFFK